MGNTVIEIDNVKKLYRLGAIGGGTLKGDIYASDGNYNIDGADR